MPISSATLKRLAELRLHEARVLLDHHCYEGAYYLAGYAVECALKAILALSFREAEFPDKSWVHSIHTHHLGQLLKHANLEAELARSCAENTNLEAYWNAARLWSEQERYKIMNEDGEVSGQNRAEALVRAVGDPNDGVLQWLMIRLP